MKKKLIIAFVLISYILCVTIICINKNFSTTIIMRSPGQCAQKIIIKSDGEAEYIIGGITSYIYYEEFTGFDYIKNKYKFNINSKNDIEFINNKIMGFKNSSILNKQKKDALRMELFIDSGKKIDIYGKAPEDLLLILERLKKYIPTEVDYACW